MYVSTRERTLLHHVLEKGGYGVKVIQIIPANHGGLAWYKTDEGPSSAPIIGYALVELPTGQKIFPLIAWGDKGYTDLLDPDTHEVIDIWVHT